MLIEVVGNRLHIIRSCGMNVFISSLYKKVTNFTLAAVIAVSSIAAAGPFIFAQNANAAAHVVTTGTGFNTATGWTDDRATPSGGFSLSDAALSLNVDGDAAPAFAGDPAFYRTEGRKATLPAGTNSIKATLTIDSAWQNIIGVRAGMWGQSANDPAVYPILEFSNRNDANDQVAGTAVIRAWDSNNGWVNLITNPVYGATYTFEIAQNPYTNTFDFYINNASTPARSVSTTYNGIAQGPLSTVIFNSYNSRIAGNDYTVTWNNFQTGVFAANTAPTVTFSGSTPANNTPVSGTITSHTTATDDYGMAAYFIRFWKDAYEIAGGGTLVGGCASAPGAFLLGTSVTVDCDYDTTALPDGTKIILSAQVIDGNNIWGEATRRTVTVDNTDPTITVKPESVGASDTFKTVSFKLYDAQKIDKVTINGVVKDLTNNTYSDVNGVKPGTFGAVEGENTIVVYDVAGNTTTYVFTLDTIAPTANLIFPGYGPTAKGFSVQFNEAVNAADATNPANYRLNNWPGAGGSGDLVGDATIVYNATSHLATVTFTDANWYISGEQEWGVQNVRDIATNVLNPTPTYEYSSLMVNPTDPGTPTTTTPTNSTTFDWTWAASTDPGNEQASGLKGYEYILLVDGVTPTAASVWTTTTATTATTSVIDDGVYQLYVRALDNAGNKSNFVSGTVVIDTTAPVVTGDTYTQNGNVITPNLVVDDAEGVTYAWEYVSGPVNGVTLSDDEILTPTFTVVNDGSYTYRLTATDDAGNASTKLFSFTYVTPAAPANTQGDNDTDDDDDTTIALNNTPTIVGPGFSNVAVLGASDAATTDDGTADVAGATDDKTAAVDTDVSDGSIFGLAWYWWILILAAIAGLVWWIIGAIRRRNADA